MSTHGSYAVVKCQMKFYQRQQNAPSWRQLRWVEKAGPKWRNISSFLHNLHAKYKTNSYRQTNIYIYILIDKLYNGDQHPGNEDPMQHIPPLLSKKKLPMKLWHVPWQYDTRFSSFAYIFNTMMHLNIEC